MTRFSDPIESGNLAPVSALSSRAGCTYRRTRRFTGGGNQTWTGMFPYGAINVDCKLFIMAVGSATTSDRITISTSAGSTTLGTISQMGSAAGILRSTTVGLGVLAMTASACFSVGPNQDGAEVPFQIILSSVDTATDYRLEMSFARSFDPRTSN